jgi:hypothetical protein
MYIREVQDKTADKLLEFLSRCQNEHGVWDADVALSLLGNARNAGSFFAHILESELRGWHPTAAYELRKILARDPEPPVWWIEKLWNYTRGAITADPDEMPNLFALMHSARSDSVREWLAEPLVSLCEGSAAAYRWFGFEGLECLVESGGLTHLKRLVPRLARLAKTEENEVYREAANHVLGLSQKWLYRDSSSQFESIKSIALVIKKRVNLYREFAQRFGINYDQSLQNTIPAYATK